jgi:tryptophan synthase alpha chain
MSGGTAGAFAAARRERRGAFLPFLTSGFPDLAESDRLASALCEEGADVLELGVPFSDPLADGPTIQRTTQIALEGKTTLAHVLGQAMRLRSRHATPIVLMSYVNPIHRYGVERFAKDARAAGVDGVILVDLPPEEDPTIWEAVQDAGLETVALVTPTTDRGRMPAIAARARGFLYVVARLGVTGKGTADPEIQAILEQCRAYSPLPRCIGFGMSPSSDLAPYRGRAEGVIVGSSLLDALLAAPDAASRERKARDYASAMRARLPGLWDPAAA